MRILVKKNIARLLTFKNLASERAILCSFTKKFTVGEVINFKLPP